MKRIILMSVIALMAILSNYQASAEVITVTIKYEKGTKEWNKDKTATECVGKGVCKIEIGGTVGIYQKGAMGTGTLELNTEGDLGMNFPIEMLADEYWSETLKGGNLYIGKDIELNNDVRRKLGGNCPTVIRAGSYQYHVKGNLVFVNF